MTREEIGKQMDKIVDFSGQITIKSYNEENPLRVVCARSSMRHHDDCGVATVNLQSPHGAFVVQEKDTPCR